MITEPIGIILINGAGLGTFIWNDLTPYINYPVLTIEFPNREVDDKANNNLTFADYRKSAIDQIEKWNMNRIVIVTHSIGGCIGLSLTEYLADRLAGFVGISAAIPENGSSFISCLPFPQRFIMPLILQLFGTKPPQKSIEHELCNDLTPNQSLEIVKRFTPESIALYTTKINYKKFDTKMLFIKLLNDKSFTISVQEKMINQLNAKEVVTINSGHLPMISKPKELADILNRFMKNLSEVVST